ncbi:uncharacterized protein B0H64DRAFT_383466 [Chaetomium fimeti]|uniref:Pentatricopeptide repeat domain-containing protein n=1 Tax=Chaetomium fimeti TaxID=1854472 RepID=A0AAE0HRJ9_9PEZI|nr:hypothetical protein B0H64DRAFT_383466 [Chaetomium fimeti]
MTLGSALPWRTCSSPLGRIQHRICFSALKSRPVGGHGAFFRPQSTNTDPKGPLEPVLPTRERSAEDAAASALTSLISRLGHIPIRPQIAHESIVVKPVAAQYPHKREAREALHKHHRALTQQLRLDKQRRQDRDGDWRTILQHLMKSTLPHAKSDSRIKVIIPKHSIEFLLSDHRKSLWNIKARTGCAINLYRPSDEGANLDPYVTLGGQPAAISTAVDDILKVTKGITVVNTGEPQGNGQDGSQADQAPADGSGGSAFTATIIQPHHMSVPWRPYKLDMRVDQIPRPSEWTTEAFEQYVAALTMGEVDAGIGRRLYPPGKTHKKAVVQQLREVFNNSDASDAVSIPALNMALRYLTADGATYLSVAEELIDRATKLDLRMDANIYNLLAETAVQSKNLLAFETTVSQMIVNGHKPNLRTWLLFLRLVEVEEIRRYIIQAMGIKGLLSDPMTVTQVSGIMADHDAYRAVQQGQNLDAFIAELHELYGAGWKLHQRAACRYLDVLGQYGKFDESKQLLEYMFKCSNGLPNDVALNTILTHCKNQRKVDLAVAFVRMFDERGRNVADQITFKLLYEMARQIQKPQLLGAVWRYAHRVGMTNHQMRDHGIKLLAGHKYLLFRLTKLMRGMWAEPHNCRIGMQEFIETLLLCDYDMSRFKSKIAQGRPKKKRNPPKAALPSTSDAPDALDDAPSGSEKARLNSEPDGPSGSSPDESHSGSTRIPGGKADGVEGGDGEQVTTVYAAEAYDLFARAMHKGFRKVKPAVPLGTLLQAALDCDRRLNLLSRQEKKSVPGMGVPVDMFPLKLPVVRVGEKELESKARLRWLTEKTNQERAARAKAKESGFAHVTQGTAEAAEEEDDWNNMMLAGYEAGLGEKTTR